MNRKSLISLTTAAIAVAMASGANAQETASIVSKPNSIGPAIEFNGGGTSFGIKGKIGVGSQISIRPTILFGYTPSVSGSTFGQALTSGINNLTALVTPTRAQQITAAIAADPTLTAETAAALLDKKDPTDAEKQTIATAQTPVFRYTTLKQEDLAAQLSAFSGVPLTDRQADEFAKQLVAAANVTDSTKLTPEQQVTIAKAQGAIARYDIETFKKLTPAQQQLLVKTYSPAGSTDKQISDTVTALNSAVNTDPTKRTEADNSLLASTQSNVRNNNTAVNFIDLTSGQQRDLLQSFSQTPLTPAEVTSLIGTLNAAAEALQTPADQRTDDQKTAIANANQAIGIQSNSLTPGFTPGSGTAYGVAVTYDFQSADGKLSGYVGPRIMLANGSSKIGSFDTSTNETSIGLLVGADYAISSDLTAGLSATYNFSKSGDLTVTGPGGFKGSAPVSGSSLDIGVNFGYRF
jgi:opacity protein-like surface antigen